MRSRNREKRLLILSRPSVRPFTCISAALTGGISVEFDIADYIKSSHKLKNLVKVGKNVGNYRMT